MKIAIPVDDDKGMNALLADHFGRAGKFAVYDDVSKKMTVIDNVGQHFGGPKPTPVLLKDNQVNVLVCKGLGRKAIAMFEELDIGVYITTEPIVQQALDSYLAGKLLKATETDGCAGHEHH